MLTETLTVLILAQLVVTPLACVILLLNPSAMSPLLLVTRPVSSTNTPAELNVSLLLPLTSETRLVPWFPPLSAATLWNVVPTTLLYLYLTPSTKASLANIVTTLVY